MPDSSDPLEQASFFAEISRDLMKVGEERPTLLSVTEHAVDAVPACDCASLTLRRRRGRTETAASSSDLATRADQLQYDEREGPCLQAAFVDEPQICNQLSGSREWPKWGPRAAEIGINGVLSIQLSTSEEVIGALNLYATHHDGFGRDDVDVAVIYTTHATNALTAARLASGLRTAVHSRHQIGVAQGILMQTYELTMEQSFELLRRYASQTNTKMGVLAEHVVTHRALPDHHS